MPRRSTAPNAAIPADQGDRHSQIGKPVDGTDRQIVPEPVLQGRSQERAQVDPFCRKGFLPTGKGVRRASVIEGENHGFCSDPVAASCEVLLCKEHRPIQVCDRVSRMNDSLVLAMLGRRFRAIRCFDVQHSEGIRNT